MFASPLQMRLAASNNITQYEFQKGQSVMQACSSVKLAANVSLTPGVVTTFMIAGSMTTQMNAIAVSITYTFDKGDYHDCPWYTQINYDYQDFISRSPSSCFVIGQSFPDGKKQQHNLVLYMSIRVCWYPNARTITIQSITSFDKSKVLYTSHEWVTPGIPDKCI